jgi:hypothetical protein
MYLLILKWAFLGQLLDLNRKTFNQPIFEICRHKYLFRVILNFFGLNTVIIFLARNGRIRAIKFRPKNFGRISFDLGEISPNQQILRLNNGRNSPNSEEIRPKFLRANLNCADSRGSPEKISTVNPSQVPKMACYKKKLLNVTIPNKPFKLHHSSGKTNQVNQMNVSIENMKLYSNEF